MDIILKNIYKSYNNESVFKDFNYVFKENQITFIQGKSGSGKTTLIRLLMGLENIDKGSIEGILDKKISVVFQEDRLCENLTLMSNIKLVANNIDKSLIIEYLEQIGLENCAYKSVKDLSGGMKRRVAILRALLYEFELLILDEPFKGLDDDTKLKVIEFLKDKIKDKTVIIVTHDIDEINYFAEFKNDICNI